MEWIILALVAGVIGYGIVIYNGLVALRNRVRNAFSQIDVQLQRRYDLIPNLVETAKGYMAHERETLEAVGVPVLVDLLSLLQGSGQGIDQSLQLIAQDSLLFFSFFGSNPLLYVGEDGGRQERIGRCPVDWIISR